MASLLPSSLQCYHFETEDKITVYISKPGMRDRQTLGKKECSEGIEHQMLQGEVQSSVGV